MHGIESDHPRAVLAQRLPERLAYRARRGRDPAAVRPGNDFVVGAMTVNRRLLPGVEGVPVRLDRNRFAGQTPGDAAVCEVARGSEGGRLRSTVEELRIHAVE